MMRNDNPKPEGWRGSEEFPKILDHLVIVGRASLNTPDKLGMFPIQIAITNHQHEYVQQLVNLGAWVNITNKEGNNLLHLAAVNGDLAALETFVNRGVDVNARNEKGETPLFRVPYPGVEKIELLVGAGADVNIISAETSVLFQGVYTIASP